MYHFVQPATDGPVNGLKSLDPSAFREQLAYIRRHYTPVSVFDLVRSVEAATPLPPQPIVLTFDDGYRGHYRHVFPLLDTLSIPAVFFPVASALLDRRVLDVNKIQCLLAATSDVGRLVGAIEAAIEGDPHGSRAPSEYRAEWWKASRWDPPPVVYVKRLLQHALPERVRRPLLDDLFRELVSEDEAAFAEELYMSVSQARELCAAGMTVGAHGDRHVRLPDLVEGGSGARNRRRPPRARRARHRSARLRVLLRQRRVRRTQRGVAARARVRSRVHDTAGSRADRCGQHADAAANRRERSADTGRRRAQRVDAPRCRRNRSVVKPRFCRDATTASQRHGSDTL